MLLGRIRRDDSGFGLILVIGTAGIITGLMLLAGTTAIRSLQSSRKHVSFESALAATESGIDAGLARAQTAYDTGGVDSYAIPAAGDPTCNAPSVAWPWPSSTPTQAQEQAWAS